MCWKGHGSADAAQQRSALFILPSPFGRLVCPSLAHLFKLIDLATKLGVEVLNLFLQLTPSSCEKAHPVPSLSVSLDLSAMLIQHADNLKWIGGSAHSADEFGGPIIAF